MKTVKIKFTGKWAGITPEQNTICYWLKKNGYDVQVTDDADYIICDVLGEKQYEYCGYPQIRIFESGENITPDFNLVDYAISRYPIQFGDRNFYYPGCTMSGRYWHALANKDRDYSVEFVKEKEFLAWGTEKPKECAVCSYRHLCNGGCKNEWFTDASGSHNYFCASFQALFRHALPRMEEIAKAERIARKRF